MDALKKAELAKRQGGGDASGAGVDDNDATGLTLAPLPDAEFPRASGDEAASHSGSSLSLATHLEELDAQFLEEAAAAARQIPPSSIAAERTEPPSPPPPAPPPAPPAVAVDPLPRTESPIEAPLRRVQPDPDAEAQVKAAAQNLFAAKQPEKQESRKGFAIAIGVLTVLSVAGIGGYFWWQLQPKGAMVAKPAVPPAPLPAAPSIAAVSPAPTPTAQAATTPALGAAATMAASGTKPAALSKAGDDDSDDDAAAKSARPPPRTRRAAPRVEPEDDSPVRVTREPLRVDPAINRGFEAFNRGELTMAQLEYERARKTDPRNPDVLHGLAAIALRQGRFDQAEAYYRQVLESDPQDSVALAALLNQRGQMDPGATESRLKSLAATQPDLAAPHFSLGNLYARQARWADAQQAYFRAYSAEPDNPDILYNLAISLEHLRQNKLAAQYYAQAIAAAASHPAGFDKAQAAARLKSLQP
ncbi:MAG: tetratricopeptide repeat protein [Rhodocyclales bacterium]|nr:tetratricopeptide repeat protein [Rhodocyclales bacterium]